MNASTTATARAGRKKPLPEPGQPDKFNAIQKVCAILRVLAQPCPRLSGEFHPLPILVAGDIGVAELDPPRFVSPAFRRCDVCLELHRVGTGVGDGVDEGMGRAQTAVMGLTDFADDRDTMVPVEYSHATHSPYIPNG